MMHIVVRLASWVLSSTMPAKGSGMREVTHNIFNPLDCLLLMKRGHD